MICTTAQYTVLHWSRLLLSGGKAGESSVELAEPKARGAFLLR